MDILKLIGRESSLFVSDSARIDAAEVAQSSFLVIGGAGSIGQAVVKNLFARSPRKLHVVDISENNLVELVRDIRSSLAYATKDFKVFALDCGSPEFRVMMAKEGPYDYVLNLSAMKHVRSEKDPYTLMRMVQVNIINTIDTIDLALSHGAKKYFCVSTDKAANPVNMMGASKRIMELFLMQKSRALPISTARFANVAFSDGSLPLGFTYRLQKRQPLSAPRDVRRYFVTPEESGALCVCSALLGGNREIFFPKLEVGLNELTFSEIAVRYLHQQGYEPVECASEDEARSRIDELLPQKKWPVHFFVSDTTGEKDFEEFFTQGEDVDLKRYADIGIVRYKDDSNEVKLRRFLDAIAGFRGAGDWSRSDLIELFVSTIDTFNHLETGKFLDNRM